MECAQDRARRGQLGRVRFASPAAAARQGGMRQEQSCCSPPQKGYSLVNTVLNMPVNSRASQAVVGSGTGAVGSRSGPLLLPLAVPCLPKRAAGSAPGQGCNHSHAHLAQSSFVQAALETPRAPPWVKGWHAVLRGGQNSLCFLLASAVLPVVCQARQGRMTEASQAGSNTHCSWTAAGLGTVPFAKVL